MNNQRYCLNSFLLRGIITLLVGLTTAIGVADEGRDLSVHAAPGGQARASSTGTLAVVGASRAHVYATPGGESISELMPGTVLTAVGRSADNLWVMINNDSDLSGWMEVSEVVLFALEQLPVMVEGTLPVAAPTPGVTPGAQAPVLMPTTTATPLPSPTPTPSPIPTEGPIPSPTPSPKASLTLAPTLAPTLPSPVTPAGNSSVVGQSSLIAVVRNGGAGLYDRPGGTETDRMSTGTTLTAWGRNGVGQWLAVMVSSGATRWVQTADVVVFNVEELPVLAQSDEEGSAESAAVAQLMSTADAGNVEENNTPSTNPNMITASVTVRDARLNIRSGPGTEFSIISNAGPGDVFEVSGRNAAATWVELITPEVGYEVGWVAADFVTLSHPILGIPSSEAVSQAAPASTPTTVTVTHNIGTTAGLSGRLIFQSTNGGTIYVYELASDALYPLTTGFDPTVSPDGKTVAFTRFGGEHGLYLIDIDGKNERLIWNGGQELRGATWSPDGKWIAFVRVAGSYNCRDVGFGICLPNDPLLNDFSITSQPEFVLSRVDFNGQNYRELDALNTVQAPSWHPDGIVYQASTGLEITADQPEVETKALVQARYYQDPAWQPNGNRIVFQAREGSHWEIFSINTDGTGLYALTRPATALVDAMPSNVSPAWSPDGKSIVFLSNRNQENGAGEWRIWVMGADGTNQRPLPVDVALEYSFVNEQTVSWGLTS